MGNGCPAGLIELRNTLKRELQDEADASKRYREAAIKFLHYKKELFAEELREISVEEHMHNYILSGIVDAITTECGE